MATLTVGFDFQHGVFYECATLIIPLKLGAWNRQTDRQTEAQTPASLNASTPTLPSSTIIANDHDYNNNKNNNNNNTSLLL